jgi:hypothetical protein
VAERVRKLALASLSTDSRSTTNLYQDEWVLPKGTLLGPEFQSVTVDRPSVLVFVDADPRANFGHACSYLLYDARTTEELRRFPAQFPPYPLEPSGTLHLFHEPVPVAPGPAPVFPPSTAPCPPLLPPGRRYAILFAGVVDYHHLNDLELCYRMLVDLYRFSEDDIFALVDSGHPDKTRGPFASGHQTIRPWPNESSTSPFRIKVRGAATRANFREVLQNLAPDITSDDLIFIHTDGHGGFSTGSRAESFICTHSSRNPAGGEYAASKFGADLGLITKQYRALLVMMGQCCGGGFTQPILDGSTASATSVACAAEADGTSHWESLHTWNAFAFDWLKAQMGQELDGTKLAPAADAPPNGAVEASEAYNYALTRKVSGDTPNYKSSSQPLADNIAFSLPNPLATQWCSLVSPVVNEYYTTDMPAEKFYKNLHRALPELQRVVMPVLQRHARAARQELAPRIDAIVAAAFKRKPPRARKKR